MKPEITNAFITGLEMMKVRKEQEIEYYRISLILITSADVTNKAVDELRNDINEINQLLAVCYMEEDDMDNDTANEIRERIESLILGEIHSKRVDIK